MHAARFMLFAVWRCVYVEVGLKLHVQAPNRIKLFSEPQELRLVVLFKTL